MKYRAAASIGIFVFLGAGPVAMAADREHEDVQLEMLASSIGRTAAVPTGTLKEQTSADSEMRYEPRDADEGQPEEVMPSWLRWPSLVDF